MLTNLKVKNFKKLDDVTIELGSNVVMIGPNNSGKTTALQALALWDIGVRRWNEKRKGKTSPEKRPGVTINRRDLFSIPVPNANLLWRNLHSRNVDRVKNGEKISTATQNIRIEIVVSGVTKGIAWECGLEFDLANEESLYCRPLRLGEKERMNVPEGVDGIKVAFLPPMSGLTDREFIKQAGEIGVLIGQGQTAQVLRNLCYQIFLQKDGNHNWKEMVEQIRTFFGIELLPPNFIAERSEIIMSYKDEYANILDLSSSGRGLQQTILLMAYLYSNPGTILLLDEPDAHLEILRQRQIYNFLVDLASKQNSQIIIASHSEVVLAEAAENGTVIAFLGKKPHCINDRGWQLGKALSDIGWDQYYQAEQTGWVLYLEGASDLEILRSFAITLGHPAIQILSRPFVHYISTNIPQKCRDHFYGLCEAKPDLQGIAIFDRLEKELQENESLIETMWKRREIENYFCTKEVLLAYARYNIQEDDLFSQIEIQRRVAAMEESIREVEKALETLGKPETKPWSEDIKASDDFLNPVLKNYFDKLSLPVILRKTDYHQLTRLIPKEQIDKEIVEKLDAIVAVAEKGKPVGE